MKKTFLIIILLCGVKSIFATNPISINVADHGAIPNDGKDDFYALKSAFSLAVKNKIVTIVFPAGVYDIHKPNSFFPTEVNEPNIDLNIVGLGNVTIKYNKNSTTYSEYFIKIDCEKGLPNIRISNITFDGSNKVATGVYNRGTGTNPNASLILDNCKFLNFKQDKSTSTNAAGIHSEGKYKTISVSNCVFENINRGDDPRLKKNSCTGLSISDVIGTAIVTNCYFNNIKTPFKSEDADGVKIFGFKEGNSRKGKATVRDCYFKNCEGRAIKFQVTDCLADNNTIEHDSGKTIIDYHSVDAQCGGGIITNNKIIFKKGVRLGTSAMPIMIQIDAYKDDGKPKHAIIKGNYKPKHAIIKNNLVLTDVFVPYFTGIPHPTKSDANVIIKNNIVDNLSDDNTNSRSLKTFCKYEFTNDTNNKHLNLTISDNTVNGSSGFLLFTKGEAVKDRYVDMTAKINLTVTGNKNTKRTKGSLFSGSLFKNPGKIKIDFLTLYANTGWHEQRWYGYLNAIKIGNGSVIPYGDPEESGGLIDGHKTEKSWVIIQKIGRIIRSQYWNGKKICQATANQYENGKLKKLDWIWIVPPEK